MARYESFPGRPDVAVLDLSPGGEVSLGQNVLTATDTHKRILPVWLLAHSPEML